MFNKLVSNLPFNPSLIHQVVFYGKRLKQESAIRRLGFIFIVLTMLLQVFAVISPAGASNQCSNNDVVRCGFRSRDEAVKLCKSNTYAFGTIINYYGVSCDTVASSETKTISATADGNQLFSMGRNPYSKPGEYPVSINNAGKFYLRPLSSWGSSLSHKVLSMKTPDGAPFMLMYDCGNIIIRKGYTPPAKPEPSSDLKLAKVNKPTGEVKPGDQIEYTLAFTNKGGTAAFFSVNDVLPNELEYVSSASGSWFFENKTPNLKWYNNTPPFYTFGNTDALGTPGFITLKTRVKSNIVSGTVICNKAYLQDVDKNTKQTRNHSEVTVCNTVRIPCPDGQIPNGSGGCEPVVIAAANCTYLKVIKEPSRTKRTFEAKATALNGATISSYTYDFGDGTAITTQNNTKDLDTIEHTYAKAGTYSVKTTVKTSLGDKTSNDCQTKVVISDEPAVPIIAYQKKAKNITKNVADANGTTASAGDVIEYSLTTTNFGKGDAKDFVLASEQIADILEYANLDFNSLNGASFDQEGKVLSWDKKLTIKPSESVTKTFRVTIKDPLPQTPTPSGNRGSFDLTMTNVYGNTVEIKLPNSVAKTVEKTTTLPNTGPGTSLAIGFVITTLVGYFFARSRLLSKEIDIIKADYNASAGGA